MRYSYGVKAQLEWLSMFACRGAGAIAPWNDLTSGERCKTPHSEVFTPHSRIPLLISLIHEIVGSMGMPIVALEPYTKSDHDSFIDPHKDPRDSRIVGKRDESLRICFFPTHPTLH